MLDAIFAGELNALTFDLLGSGYSQPTPLPPVKPKDGFVHLSIEGALMRDPSRVRFSQTADTGAIALAFRELAMDERVNRVLVSMNSPGGSSSGIEDCAAAMRELAAAKPTFVSVGSVCASAAYWIASGATKIYASRSSIVGSIGTYTSLLDASVLMERIGIKVHVLRSSEFKGAGAIVGDKITEEQLGAVQKLVDDLTAIFVDGITQGRKRPMAHLATGQVWLGAESKQLGLIDEIGNEQDAMRALMATRTQPTPDQSLSSNMRNASWDQLDTQFDALVSERGTEASVREIYPAFCALHAAARPVRSRRH